MIKQAQLLLHSTCVQGCALAAKHVCAAKHECQFRLPHVHSALAVKNGSMQSNLVQLQAYSLECFQVAKNEARSNGPTHRGATLACSVVRRAAGARAGAPNSCQRTEDETTGHGGLRPQKHSGSACTGDTPRMGGGEGQSA